MGQRSAAKPQRRSQTAPTPARLIGAHISERSRAQTRGPAATQPRLACADALLAPRTEAARRPLHTWVDCRSIVLQH